MAACNILIDALKEYLTVFVTRETVKVYISLNVNLNVNYFVIFKAV